MNYLELGRAKQSFTGVWRLESYTETPNFPSRERPFEEAAGILIYTEDGWMSAQLTVPNRGLPGSAVAHRPFSRVNEHLVNTKANLSFDIFADICSICCVSTVSFVHKANFIDVILLKRRNAIAHAEDTFVGLEDFDQVTDQTVEIMRIFGDALENHVYLKDYKSA